MTSYEHCQGQERVSSSTRSGTCLEDVRGKDAPFLDVTTGSGSGWKELRLSGYMQNDIMNNC